MSRSRGCKDEPQSRTATRTGTAVAEASGQDGDEPQSRIALSGHAVLHIWVAQGFRISDSDITRACLY